MATTYEFDARISSAVSTGNGHDATYEDGVCEKIFETTEEASASRFEVPYYVTRMPMTMSDGAESVGYGVVDPELVAAFAQMAR